MAYQAVFKRYEMKYLLTEAQKQAVLAAMEGHMALDKYGRTTIRNIYFDTDNYRLIRRSLERPVYKEKLRIRSYCRADATTPVFVELKKKFEGVVYKRRVALPEADAMGWICQRQETAREDQITREICYFMDYYGALHPTVYLCYDRMAYYATDCTDLRLTLDDTILYRREALSLTEAPYGTPLLPEGLTLMEIKSPGSIPLWLTQTLTENKIFKTSFSKYGAAYLDLAKTKQEVSPNGNNI